METTSRKVNADTPELLSFVAGAQKIADDNRQTNYPRNYAQSGLRLEAQVGPRYIRIKRVEYDRADEKKEFNGSGHCFVDRTNGDVLKCAGWKAPAKGARGNIFDAQNGLGRMGPYGTAHNR